MSKLTKPQLIELNAKLATENADLRAQVAALTLDVQLLKAQRPNRSVYPNRRATLFVNGVARCSYFRIKDAYAARLTIKNSHPHLQTWVQEINA